MRANSSRAVFPPRPPKIYGHVYPPTVPPIMGVTICNLDKSTPMGGQYAENHVFLRVSRKLQENGFACGSWRGSSRGWVWHPFDRMPAVWTNQPQWGVSMPKTMCFYVYLDPRQVLPIAVGGANGLGFRVLNIRSFEQRESYVPGTRIPCRPQSSGLLRVHELYGLAR